MKISEVKQWEARVREEGSGGEWSHDLKNSFTGRLVCAWCRRGVWLLGSAGDHLRT